MLRKNRYVKVVTMAALILLSCSRIVAQDTLQTGIAIDIDEVVVTYQAGKQTPVTFQNLDLKEIKEKSTGQEPSFLFSEKPSMTSYSDAGNSQGYSYLRLRGIDQTRINITLDGVPLNEPEDQGAYFSNYPDILNSVGRLQIQRGVGTTKNGVASYGGSIQLFSPNLNDSAKTTFGLGYGSFNSLRVFGEYNSGVKNRKALYARASHIYSDGYKYNSFNNSQSVFLSGGLFYDKSTWKLNILAGQQQNGMAWIGVSDSLINDDRRNNANTEQEKDRFMQCLVQLQNYWQINYLSAIQSSVYYTFLKGDYDFDLNNYIGLPSTDELYNYAVRSNLTGFFTNYTFSKKRFNWTTGFHGNVYDRRHTGSEKAMGRLYRNTGYKNEVSTFTKADYTFHRFTFFADMQYRYVNFDYDGSVALQKMSWRFFNPKAGLSVAINPGSTVYYSIGGTGREPTRNDMFGGEDDLLADNSGHPVLSGTDAEYVINHELGFRYKKNRLDFNLNLYYMDFDNEIVLDGKFGPNGLALTNNVEQSIRTGIELSVAYDLSKHFALINNSSFNYSRIKEQKETFSPILTPPVIINQEAVYTAGRLSIALSARYQHRSYIDFANSETVNGYFLLNSRASYRVKGFLYSLFVNNITNTQYFNHGYVDFDESRKSFVQAPVNFYTSVQYSF